MRGSVATCAVGAVGAVGALAPLYGFRSLGDGGAPKLEPWSLWEASDEESLLEPDYSVLNALLAKHLRPATDSPIGLARFDYAGVSEDEKREFFAFCDDLGSYEVFALNRRAQFAYWANLYNALTLRIVLEHWRVASIRKINISPGLFAKGPWDAPLATPKARGGAVEITLNDIEHRILRPIWRDARAHYAVNCASVGCPNLRPQAWRAETMESVLEKAAADFINSPRGVRIDGAGESVRVVVSKIYSWFIDDFGGDKAAVLAHLVHYAAPPLKEQLETIGDLHASEYDWAINAVL